MLNKLKSLVQNQKQSFSDITVNGNRSEFEVNKWILSDFVVANLLPVVGNRPFPLDELMLMSSAVVSLKPQYIFEWGTHIGKSARIFYETAKAFNIACKIHSIDLPDSVEHVEHPKEEHGMLVKGIKEVTLHRGDGISKAIELYKSFSDATRVLFFVDGDHSYESVKRELGTILNEVNNPAVLLHDTFYQSKESGYNIGPFEAIRDVLKDSKKEFKIISTQAGLPGMTLLYNIATLLNYRG
jgi:cephalosporin hydroxylase